ncbi:MAG: ChaN family lipoprotein [Pyrinomonadaceae bacterium]|nr:ChaN family lipoprotein [Pyrinomonadaceae bacterium]
MKLILLASLIIALTISATAQNKDYSVFDSNGAPTDIKSIIERFEDVDVVFLGESHDDSVGHRLQFEIFKTAVLNYGKERQIALSLEMFERDVQPVVDEYLAGLVTEKHFLAASRPWGNYKTDYRPLVETSKDKELAVIAANAPRRYVNMVTRLGRDSLYKLPKESRQWMAPLPYGKASKAYIQKFNALMASFSDNAAPSNHNPIINAQSLWDATMAHSISEFLWSAKDPLVVHLNGSFHTEKWLGIPEHLVRYKEGTKFLVVTMRYEKEFTRFNPDKHKDLGDYIVLTDAQAPRSKR